VRRAGKKLEEFLGYGFSVVDATYFSDWYNGNNSLPSTEQGA